MSRENFLTIFKNGSPFLAMGGRNPKTRRQL